MSTVSSDVVVPLWQHSFGRRTLIGGTAFTSAILISLGIWSWLIVRSVGHLPDVVVLLDIVGLVMLLSATGYGVRVGLKPAPRLLRLSPDSLTLIRRPALGWTDVSVTAAWSAVRLSPARGRAPEGARLIISDRGFPGGVGRIFVKAQDVQILRDFVRNNGIVLAETVA
jgi:hypothetical protein